MRTLERRALAAGAATQRRPGATMRVLGLALALLLCSCLSRLDLRPCRTDLDCELNGYCLHRDPGDIGHCVPAATFAGGDAGVADAGVAAAVSRYNEREPVGARTNETLASPEVLPLAPLVAQGTLGTSDGLHGDVDWYEVVLFGGVLYQLAVTPLPGSAAIPTFSLRGGDPLTAAYQPRGPLRVFAGGASRQVVVPVTGRYLLRVADVRNELAGAAILGGETFRYQLDLHEVSPLASPLGEGEWDEPVRLTEAGELAVHRLDLAAPRRLIVRAQGAASSPTPAEAPVLQLFRQAARSLELVASSEGLDRDGTGLDARLAELLPSGSYLLFVETRRLGGAATALDLAVRLTPPDREDEPNDTQATATPVSLAAGAITGQLGAPVGGVGDVDYLRFDALAGERWQLTLTAGDALRPKLTIVDPAGRALASQENLPRAPTTSLEWVAPMTGRYALRVEDVRGAQRPAGDDSAFAYTLSARPLAQTPLLLGTLSAVPETLAAERLESPGSTAWYRFLAPPGKGLLRVEVTPVGAPWEPEVLVLMADGASPVGTAETAPSERFVVDGEYWLGVRDLRGRGGVGYRLEASWAPLRDVLVAGGRPQDASPLELPARVVTATKSVGETWFSADFPAGVLIDTETRAGTLEGTPVDTRLELYDAALRLLAADDNGGRAPFSRVRGFAVPRRGRYYLRLDAAAGEGGDVVLAMDARACDASGGARRPAASGDLVFNEVVWRPEDGADLNGDERASASEDAFVELVNRSAEVLDVGGVSLRDSNSDCDPSGRHVLFTFPCGTLVPAGGAAVVFGGGTPYGSFGGSRVFVSTYPTRCRLHLEPAGDTLRLVGTDALELARFTMRPGADCASGACDCAGPACARRPDGTGAFVPAEPTPGAGFEGQPLGPPPPAHDLCESAAPLTPGVQRSDSAATATDNDSGTCGAGGAELVYWFDLAQTSDVELSAPGATALWVRDTCGRTEHRELGCSTSQILRLPELPGDAQSPRRYYVFVEAPGAFELRLTTTLPTAPVPNDRCAVGRELVVGETLLAQTTAGATDDYAAPRSCGALPDSLPGPDVAYRLRLRAGEAVELTVEPEWPFDPALVLARDCTTRETQCLAATDLGGSGEPETLRFQAPSSGDYYVIVDTYRPGGTGRFALSARAVQP